MIKSKAASPKSRTARFKRPVPKALVSIRQMQKRPAHLIAWAAELTPMEMIEESRKGVRGKELQRLQEEMGFSNSDWSRFLQLASRTIERYKAQNSVMDSGPSERALLMAQITEHGRAVFGSNERFMAWLNGPTIALGGKTPNDFLDTILGMQMVRAEITGIEHGVY